MVVDLEKFAADFKHVMNGEIDIYDLIIRRAIEVNW